MQDNDFSKLMKHRQTINKTFALYSRNLWSFIFCLFPYFAIKRKDSLLMFILRIFWQKIMMFTSKYLYYRAADVVQLFK